MSFVQGLDQVHPEPDYVYITSLFTYSWKPVHDAAAYYRSLYPKAKIVLGGIYATLMPEHATLTGVDEVHKGLYLQVEGFRPDYDLVPDWKSSILFATRGCIRKCAFCAVPRLEGKTWGPATGIADIVNPEHKKVVLWDNNILGVPNWVDVVAELKRMNVQVDFNQGLDARLIDKDVANELSGLRISPIRMAYDIPSERKALERAIPALEAAGFGRRQMIVYTLYNFTDTPEEFFSRVKDLLSWGVVSYPMRYEPLNSLVKNKYVSPHWTADQLEMVARARRVIGFGGAFPPYVGLVEKLTKATSFEDAFSLRESHSPRRSPVAVAGTIEPSNDTASPLRASFRDLFNDPATLKQSVSCDGCGSGLDVGDPAFAVQDDAGRYVGYICATCHPNQKWVGALWRTALGYKPTQSQTETTQLPIGLINRTVH